VSRQPVLWRKSSSRGAAEAVGEVSGISHVQSRPVATAATTAGHQRATQDIRTLCSRVMCSCAYATLPSCTSASPASTAEAVVAMQFHQLARKLQYCSTRCISLTRSCSSSRHHMKRAQARAHSLRSAETTDSNGKGPGGSSAGRGKG
jgi:hypothetical protein